jgi:hypothetical protein
MKEGLVGFKLLVRGEAKPMREHTCEHHRNHSEQQQAVGAGVALGRAAAHVLAKDGVLRLALGTERTRNRRFLHSQKHR